MSCAALASTGFPLLPILGLGAAGLLAGIVLLLLGRTGRSRATTILLVLLLISVPLAAAMISSSTAQATTPNCGSAPSTSGVRHPGSGTPTESGVNADVTITQTSVITGLAPGIAPVTISGIITNHGSHASYVTAVTVSIAAVTRTPDAVAGTCDAGDYTLTNPTMPVGATLKPTRAATFTGATIGFRNKPTNQDACKGATITLHYISS